MAKEDAMAEAHDGLTSQSEDYLEVIAELIRTFDNTCQTKPDLGASLCCWDAIMTAWNYTAKTK